MFSGVKNDSMARRPSDHVIPFGIKVPRNNSDVSKSSDDLSRAIKEPTVHFYGRPCSVKFGKYRKPHCTCPGIGGRNLGFATFY